MAWRGAGAVAGQATGLIVAGLRQLPGHRQGQNGASAEPREAATARPAPPEPAASAPPPEVAPPSPAAPPPPPPPEAALLPEAEPVHVSEEPVLVEELAEPGAEDGAGAQVTIDEPWDGYRVMNARAVIDRLGGATPAQLAAVELYELANRKRRTVIAAAQRELKLQT